MKENIFKVAFSFITTTAVSLLGGWDTALQTLVIIVVLDYATGLLRAAYHNKLNSKVGLKGIIKKFMYFAVVALASLIDGATGTNNHLIRDAIIFFFIANEGLSILENYTDCGLPMVPKLKEMLEQLKGKVETKGNGNDKK